MSRATGAIARRASSAAQARLDVAELQLELRRRVGRGAGRERRRRQPGGADQVDDGVAGGRGSPGDAQRRGRCRRSSRVTQPPITEAVCVSPVSESVTCSVLLEFAGIVSSGWSAVTSAVMPASPTPSRTKPRCTRDGLVGDVLQHEGQRRRERVAAREAEAEARRSRDERASRWRRPGRPRRRPAPRRDRARARCADGVPVAVAVPTSAPRSSSTRPGRVRLEQHRGVAGDLLRQPRRCPSRRRSRRLRASS